MSRFCKSAAGVLLTLALPGWALASPCDGTQVSSPTVAFEGGPITLQAALSRVRAASPAVRAAALEVRARGAEADQAGRRLNPTLDLEIENFGGSGALSGFSQNETTLSYAQTFELGGKRGKREQAALANQSLGLAECEVVLREAQLQTALAYYELVAAIELARLADEASGLSQSLAETVGRRVTAGASAPPELSRAQADAASLKAEAVAARARVQTLRYELASLWGEPQPRFALPIENLPGADTFDFAPVPTDEHPLLALADAAEEVREAERRSALANGAPDLTVSGGIRRFEGSNDNAFVLGLSVPLPLFDKNRDAARASELRRDAARINSVATQARLRADEAAARQQVRAAADRVRVYQETAVPAARSAYEASVKGYTAGRFDLTTTLDARKGLIAANTGAIQARRDLAAARMRLISLLGAAPFQGEFR